MKLCNAQSTDLRRFLFLPTHSPNRRFCIDVLLSLPFSLSCSLLQLVALSSSNLSRLALKVWGPAFAMVLRRPASRSSDTFVCLVPGLDGHYGLFKYAEPDAKGDFFGLEYCFKRKSDAEPRANRSSWCIPLQPRPDLSTKGRWDLHVRFYDWYEQWHTTYHRVVALTLLPCYWTDDGTLRERPLKVKAQQWHMFEVHHKNKNVFDVRLCNLCVVTKPLHRRLTNDVNFKLPKPKPGWGR